MPAARHQRRRYQKPPSQRSALRLLAGWGDAGCPASALVQHGYSAADMMALVYAGLAAPHAVVEKEHASDLSRVKITEAGRRALQGA
jgi:hypothetical protein